MNQGDILRHDPMGIVEETGTAVTGLAPGDRGRGPPDLLRAVPHVRGGLQTQCDNTRGDEQG